MIRQVSVPPFDRLTSFLPKPSVTDSSTRRRVEEILTDVARWDDAMSDARRSAYIDRVLA